MLHEGFQREHWLESDSSLVTRSDSATLCPFAFPPLRAAETLRNHRRFMGASLAHGVSTALAIRVRHCFYVRSVGFSLWRFFSSHPPPFFHPLGFACPPPFLGCPVARPAFFF